jgi:predicted Rossmann fold nucleotide-binding protein DprA/Smf involved in DNA uptake
MTVAEIVAEIPTMTRVTISRAWMPGSQEALNASLEGADMLPAGEAEEEDIVEAVLVSESPVETVLEAIRSGHGTLDTIAEATGIPRSSVNTILLGLVESGRITKDGTRATRLRPWRIVE